MASTVGEGVDSTFGEGVASTVGEGVDSTVGEVVASTVGVGVASTFGEGVASIVGARRLVFSGRTRGHVIVAGVPKLYVSRGEWSTKGLLGQKE